MKVLIARFFVPVMALTLSCDGNRVLSTGIASESTDSASACIADDLPELHGLPNGVPRCADGDDSCREACFAGDGPSCVASAYDAQKRIGLQGEAMQLLRRACLLGVANACTNYAATIWAFEHTHEEMACAQRVFTAACDADEHFACGMLGRIAFDQATLPGDFVRAGGDLEVSCQKLGGFPCRVLAKHLEAGDLGPYDPKWVRDLLKQACEGGDPDACGEPQSASETFERPAHR